jgi:aldehyde:ferredoxin oxidoreductase
MKPSDGYYGRILDINLSTGKAETKSLSREDRENFVGGRGLGIKILWDRINKPGIDALSPDNPLIFMPGPFSGFPVPASSRTCVVTKSPHTSPVNSEHGKASTLAYANMGGFFGPTIRFAGHDGIVVTGNASSPAYIVIDDDKVEIRDAGKFWGMKTDEFDKAFNEELGDRRFASCYIGPAGENLVEYACIINTAARAAGRGGAGCVMGSKNLKAIAVKGTQQPDVGDNKKFLAVLEKTRRVLNQAESTRRWRKIRNFACFCCPLSCKKSGTAKGGPFAGLSHDGPEYETGTMLGANLLINDLSGMLKAIFDTDDSGMDIISCGNVIGFLMEAREKKLIDKKFLDNIDLRWGNVAATLQMIDKITKREGIGDHASKGVKHLSEMIGRDSHKFAIHIKGQELAAWNIHADPPKAICYATANRGACHLNGSTIDSQNSTAIWDSLGVCRFARAYPNSLMAKVLSAITGRKWSMKEFFMAGERIYNLEKMFNFREGFGRADDTIPDRFFEEPLTVGGFKGAVIIRDEFEKSLDSYYRDRGWDPDTTRPEKSTLKKLGLGFE